MIIGISGRMGSGKDTIGTIIQGLLLTNKDQSCEIKKFAGKLKQIASILTGIPVEKFEDQDFKKNLLDVEWGTVQQIPLNSIPPFADMQFNVMMSVREFLQKLGTEAMREGLHTNVWVNALFSDYVAVVKEWDEFGNDTVVEYPNWIITDMRFPNEMEAVVKRNGITIRVTRPVKKSKNTARLHPSETSLDKAEFDYEIINDGTMEELVKKVREILTKEKLI
jgi:ABC-type dipeptide/oligopeptide/nickel transport system ATPase component